MSWLYQPAPGAAANGGLSTLTATLSVTDSADSSSAAATVGVTATFSKTDSADTFSSTVDASNNLSLTITDSADTFSATGTMGEITAVFSKTDATDSIIFDATDGSSAGALIFRAGVGRNFGGMFVIEPGSGTNEEAPNQAAAIPIRFGRFAGGLIMITAPAPTNPGPPTDTFNAGVANGGIGFGGANTANSLRTGTFSMIAGVGNLSTIDTTDRMADQGIFGIGFGGGNSGSGVFSREAIAGFGLGGVNAVAVGDNSVFAVGATNGGFGFGGSSDLFVISSTFSSGDCQIGGENTVTVSSAEFVNIQAALASLLVEDDETLRDVLRLIRAATVGKGIHGAQVEYMSADGSKARIVADLTGGNRDVVSTDPS